MNELSTRCESLRPNYREQIFWKCNRVQVNMIILEECYPEHKYMNFRLASSGISQDGATPCRNTEGTSPRWFWPAPCWTRRRWSWPQWRGQGQLEPGDSSPSPTVSNSHSTHWDPLTLVTALINSCLFITYPWTIKTPDYLV